MQVGSEGGDSDAAQCALLCRSPTLPVTGPVGRDDRDPGGEVVNGTRIFEQGEQGILHGISRVHVVAGDARNSSDDRAIVALGELLQWRRGAHELKL